jgi:hypothetical protein
MVLFNHLVNLPIKNELRVHNAAPKEAYFYNFQSSVDAVIALQALTFDPFEGFPANLQKKQAALTFLQDGTIQEIELAEGQVDANGFTQAFVSANLGGVDHTLVTGSNIDAYIDGLPENTAALQELQHIKNYYGDIISDRIIIIVQNNGPECLINLDSANIEFYTHDINTGVSTKKIFKLAVKLYEQQ